MAATATILYARPRADVHARRIRAFAAKPTAAVVLSDIKASADIIFQAAKADMLWVRKRAEAVWRRLRIASVSLVPAVVQYDDVVGCTEGVVWTLDQRLLDTVTTPEALIFDVATSYLEAVIADEKVALGFGTGFADSLPSPMDIISLHPLPQYRDDLAAQDRVEKLAALGKDDLVAAVEKLLLATAKPVDEEVSVADALAKALELVFADYTEAMDQFSFQYAETPVSDYQDVEDRFSLEAQPGFTDYATFLEQLSVRVFLAPGFRSLINALPLGEWTLGD